MRDAARWILGRPGILAPAAAALAESLPSHITSPDLFVWVLADEPIAIVKVLSSTRRPAYEQRYRLARQALACSPATGVTIRTPDLIGAEDIRGGATVLIHEFVSGSTLAGLPNTSSQQSVMSELARQLHDGGHAWLDLAPRNIIATASDGLAIVDLDHGFAKTGAASTDLNLFLRAIALLEEMAVLGTWTVPYWSAEWPALPELLESHSRQALFGSLGGAQGSSRRVKVLTSMLGLPDPLPDHCYLRATVVFASLARPIDAFGSRLLYAADHVSDVADLTELRVRLSMLMWVLRQQEDDIAAIELASATVVAGTRLHNGWLQAASCDDLRIAARASTADLAQTTDRIAARGWGSAAWDTVADEVRNFILGNRPDLAPNPTIMTEM